jgi:hypothetical protein
VPISRSTGSAPKFDSRVTKQGPARALVLFCPNQHFHMLATTSDASIARLEPVGTTGRNSRRTPRRNPHGSRNASMKFRAYKTRRVSPIPLECGLTFVPRAPDEGYWLCRQGERVPGAICRFGNHGDTIRLNHPCASARDSTNIAAAGSLDCRICSKPYLDRKCRSVIPTFGTNGRTSHLSCGVVGTRAIRRESGLSRPTITKPYRSHWL